MDTVSEIFSVLSGWLWGWPMIVLLLGTHLFLTVRLRFPQRWIFTAIRLSVKKDPDGEGDVSQFASLATALAATIGTGNIIGVSTAICLGGPGAVFWMWLLAIIGGATAFIESTLAQIYKRRNPLGHSYGGPAYYIETAMHQRWLGVLFAFALIVTYAGGFNLLCSFNMQSTFLVYSFYDPTTTPWIIGAVFAALVAYCLIGGGQRIIKVTSVLVPVMGGVYILAALIVILFHITSLPQVFAMIFADAFDFQSILGGISGSCMIYGIKRGLYSNEAGIGSAPNAAAAADVSHPVKQGLVQMLSVFIDTLLVCSATAFMGLFSGVPITKEVAGAAYVQNAASAVFGGFGPLLITICMLLFGFSTLIGNLFYVDNCIRFIHKGAPSHGFVNTFRIVCVLVVFVGAGMSMAAVWDIADILMAVMCFINIPACFILGNTAVKAMRDYQQQKKEGKNPVFKAASIGIDESTVQYWK